MTESQKSASPPLERMRTIKFEQLLNDVSLGKRDEGRLSSLAGRLAALERRADPADLARVMQASGGRTLRALAGALLDAIDPDRIEAAAGADSDEAARAAVEEA